jgi:hypothetical protein
MPIDGLGHYQTAGYYLSGRQQGRFLLKTRADCLTWYASLSSSVNEGHLELELFKPVIELEDAFLVTGERTRSSCVGIGHAGERKWTYSVQVQ